MRHRYTNKLVIGMGLLLVVATAGFAVVVMQDGGAGDDRVGDVLAIEDTDIHAGEALYVEETQPPCAACHSLSAAGASSDRASSLDDLRPTRREIVVSILGRQIRAHEGQHYRIELSDRQLADLAAYIEAVARSDG